MGKFVQITWQQDKSELSARKLAVFGLLSLLTGCSSQTGDSASESFAASSEELITCINLSVTSQSNAQLATASIREVRQVIAEMLTLRRLQREALIDLNADYAASRDQFNALLGQHATELSARRQDLMALANQFHNAVSTTELASCEPQRENYGGSVIALLSAN